MREFLALGLVDRIDAVAAISQALAALLSLAALLLSLWVFSRQQRISRWQLRLQREDHIIAWSRLCLEVLAEFEERLKLGAANGGLSGCIDGDRLIALRSRLSALIDEGRLYFPNIRDPEKGREKEAAFRGSRRPILDCLVAVYDLMREIAEPGGEGNADTGLTRSSAPAGGDAIARLNALRRTFVSATQEAIDPESFNRVRA
ncbi:MAG: hypothetical protein GC150_11980 [Rhizobiales bacterium]|nr:hypothetical protein [Hyphomicrobiales bacterium]